MFVIVTNGSVHTQCRVMKIDDFYGYAMQALHCAQCYAQHYLMFINIEMNFTISSLAFQSQLFKSPYKYITEFM